MIKAKQNKADTLCNPSLSSFRACREIPFSLIDLPLQGISPLRPASERDSGRNDKGVRSRNHRARFFAMALIIIFCSLLFSANLAFAADGNSAEAASPAPTFTKLNVIPCPDNLPCITTGTQEKGGKSVRDYVLTNWGSKFIAGFLGLIGIASVIFIIVGGVQMLLAMGNEEELGKAKKTILWAILGLVISILSVAIVTIVSNLPLS